MSIDPKIEKSLYPLCISGVVPRPIALTSTVGHHVHTSHFGFRPVSEIFLSLTHWLSYCIIHLSLMSRKQLHSVCGGTFVLKPCMHGITLHTKSDGALADFCGWGSKHLSVQLFQYPCAQPTYACNWNLQKAWRRSERHLHKHQRDWGVCCESVLPRGFGC